ncbi:MAG: hypothetical protein MZV63_61880 [Marinilabiliales bacterium]|nr:hypothetical protein [Marinilabiliales bacterium]
MSFSFPDQSGHQHSGYWFWGGHCLPVQRVRQLPSCAVPSAAIVGFSLSTADWTVGFTSPVCAHCAFLTSRLDRALSPALALACPVPVLVRLRVPV